MPEAPPQPLPEPSTPEPPPAAEPPPLSEDEQMALFEESLKETDWGHQPC